MRLAPPDRALGAFACLCGLLGVAGSAAAAHIPGADSLKVAAQFLLFHAPAILAFVALSAAGWVRVLLARVAALLIAIGLCLFCGDLALRALAGRALFPMAAPSGGFALMGGWVVGIATLIIAPRR